MDKIYTWQNNVYITPDEVSGLDGRIYYGTTDGHINSGTQATKSRVPEHKVDCEQEKSSCLRYLTK